MVRTLLLLYLLVAVVYWMLVTSMTGELIGPEWLSSLYDSLGSHLLHFNAEVDPDAIRWEGISVNGKVYAYFGPFPAFLRIVLNGFWPEFRGQWSRASCLIAGLLCVVSFGTMVSVLSAQNNRLSQLRRQLLCAMLVLGFAFGSPITYLISSARVYHEGMLWGAVWRYVGSLRCSEACGGPSEKQHSRLSFLMRGVCDAPLSYYVWSKRNSRRSDGLFAWWSRRHTNAASAARRFF
jgi:hypothetical protein